MTEFLEQASTTVNIKLFNNRIATLVDPLKTLKNLRIGVVSELTHMLAQKKSPQSRRKNDSYLAESPRGSFCNTSFGVSKEDRFGTKELSINNSIDQKKQLEQFLHPRQYKDSFNGKDLVPKSAHLKCLKLNGEISVMTAKPRERRLDLTTLSYEK